MDILEHRDKWYEQFKSGWLCHFENHGKIDWSLYNRPVNKEAVPGKAINLSASRLLFITTSGAYLPASQAPFDTSDALGAYDIRVMPSDTPYDAIDYAHTHYDQTAVRNDPQVLMPLTHLANMVADGVIGSLTPSLASYMGYQPDVSRLLDETIPAIIELANAEEADGALLVPA